MRHVLTLSIGTIVCWSIAFTLARPAFAQADASTSTIRLAPPSDVARDDAPALPPAIANYSIPNAEPREPEASAAPAALKENATASATPINQQPAPPIGMRQRMPAGFYPSAAARATLNQMPGPTPVQSVPRLPQTRRGGKPFESVQSEPAISPYLTLYGTGSNSGNQIQNYFAFVRPQMDQMDANRQQQREIQQLRSQLQKISSESSTTAPQTSTMDKSARYMDTAQFYQRHR
jgi:hypothetical protein